MTTTRVASRPGDVALPSAAMALAPGGERAVTAVSATGPWSRRDAVTFAACTLLGAALLGTGYAGSSVKVLLPQQVRFLDVAVAGLLVGTVGGGGWLRTGFRTVRRRKATVLDNVRTRFVPEPHGAVHEDHGLVTAARMTRYHRAGCSLVAGKPVTTASRADHERGGLRPCGMCLPGHPHTAGAVA